jgi:CubicO group peptidase (beta-lactamase class C family)/streptogramin lyase
MATSARLSAAVRPAREAGRRQRNPGLIFESLEPRLALATGPLGTLVSVVDDANTNLLAASSGGLAVPVNEGSAITASVQLTRRPNAPVRIAFASSGPLEIGMRGDVSAVYVPADDLTAPPPLVFSRVNWNIPQTLSIRSLEDGVADGTRTLPVRMTVSTAGRAAATKGIWVESRDSGLVSPTIAAAGMFRGTLDRPADVPPRPGLNNTVTATYGVNMGTATFRVSSARLANVRGRVISVDYIIDSANKLVVQAVRGFNPRGVNLALAYRVGGDGVPGLSGVLTLAQPERSKTDTFTVTATLVAPGMPRLDGYAPVTAGIETLGGTPAAIAIGADGTAWVANPAISAVQRLVRQAGGWTIADTVSVGGNAEAIAVAHDGAVWVANADDHTVQQIGLQSGVWTANPPIPVATPPSAIVVAADGAVWVASAAEHVVQRLASVDGIPFVTATLPVGSGPAALTVAKDGGIWVASKTANTVQRISSVRGGWQVGRPIAVGASPSSISATVDGTIWVASAETGTLQRVVRARRAWRPQPAVPTTGAPADIAAHPDGSVWVAAGDAIQRFVPTRTGWRPQTPITVGGMIAAIRSAPDGTLLTADAQAAIVKAISAVPGEVRNLAVVPTAAGTLAVTWTAPVTDQPTSYTVTMTTTTGTATSTQTLVTSNTSADFSGLSPASSYAFTVAASNARGSGPAATASFGSVEDVATQPLALSAVVGSGGGEFVLNWQPPADDGGSSVLSYTTTVYQGNSQQTVTTTSTSFTFSGLSTGGGPLLFRLRATTFAGNGLPATLAVAADGTRLSLPPSNPYMGLEGTSTMHANASSSNAIVFAGPGTTNLEFQHNLLLNATVPSILMSENGALVCVGVSTSPKTAQIPMVMLISPKTLQPLQPPTLLIKPRTGNLAGGLYNFLDHNNRLVLVNGDGVLQWYSNTYDSTTDTGTLTLENSVDIGQPMVVGLVPDYEGRIWFATQGSLSTADTPAVVGYYDPQTQTTQTYNLPAGEMVANSISASPAGVAVATTSGLGLFTAGPNGVVRPVWRQVYGNSGDRKPGQLSPGTGSTPVFFGPTTGYEYLVITDNATAPDTGNQTPAENVNVYSVADGTRVAQTGFLSPSNSGTENAPIAFGNRVFVPSTYGYWYPQPSETGTAVPGSAPFVGGFQGMTLAADGTSLNTSWGPANTVPSSALPRLSLTDNLIYTVLANSTTQGSGPSTQTTVTYSFAAIDADTGAIVGTPLPLGSNTFSGNSPDYRDTANYTWNTLQMTGVISPSGVFYQGTAGGIVMVYRNKQPELSAILEDIRRSNASAWNAEVPGLGVAVVSPTGDVVSAVSGSSAPPATTPLEPSARFHVGSLTKTFTAALIMVLDQEGLLTLDDPISRWLEYPGGDDITVRMLLGHTSGIPDFTSSAALTRKESPREAIALAAEMAPLFTPDSSWSYSNTNYTMLGLISELASGESWADQIRVRFLQPLGLTSTYVWTGVAEGPTAAGSRLACGYADEPACAPMPGLAVLPVSDGADWILAWAAGSLVSTPEDMARWMAQLVGGEVLDRDHRDLLTTATPQSQVALAAMPAFGPTRWTGASLGLLRYEIQGQGVAWGHEGSINGFVANAAYLLDSDRAVAVTSNFAMTDSFAALGEVAIRTSEG